ncbi:hypothetical protein BDY24DRAFT_371900 [Mrakia frigida]|uniref:uncharacterized protein n=1 Tax=Mrakia frigida TaxID=29902 RepID=UPI003FCBFB9B
MSGDTSSLDFCDPHPESLDVEALLPCSQPHPFLPSPRVLQSLQPLNYPTFKFSSVAPRIKSFLAAGEAFPPSKLASLPPQAYSDHQIILSVLREAISLDEGDREAFLYAQDLARQVQPRMDDGEISLGSLFAQLAQASNSPSFSSHPMDTLRPVLARVCRLRVLDVERSVILIETLMDAAESLEEGVEVATWILRVTKEDETDGGVRDVVVYKTLQSLLHLVKPLSPRPAPDLILRFLADHNDRIHLSFRTKDKVAPPLVSLLEIYTRLHNQDKRNLDSIGTHPTPDVLVELESLRNQHLDAVRSIHQAMKDVGREIFTVRSCTSLMDGYNHGRAFEEVEEIWQMMRSEGGVGIEQRVVSVYFDACGFSGSLSRAIETWEDLRTTGFNLNDNNYHAYQECLTRCGAWDELFSFFAEQQAQHLVAPTSVPPLSAPGLGAALKLGRRLVHYPRYRSLHSVDWDSYDLLKRRIEDLVSKETWEEVHRLLNSREWIDVDTGPKTGVGRREDRQRTPVHHA